MTKNINILELFSGIGGFSKGLMNAGFNFKKHYFSEIDNHAVANYKYNFHEAEYIGSVVDVRGGSLECPNIITFGSPCQDFSLAGKQLGLEGKRSVLVFEAIRIITECQPDFFIWENVKGTFSSNSGADFWAIIKAFADIGGYRLEWQLINGAWFLPQNRERIYLVGHLTETTGDFRGVFPFRESDFGIIKRQSEHDTSNVRTITAGGHSGGQHSGMTIARTLMSGTNGGQHQNMALLNNEVICVAQRGRNPENTSDRTVGAPTKQMLEPNSQGTINTLTSVAKDNYIAIVSNTKDGVDMAKEGDSINFSNPNSKTRRGRVGKSKAQTLDTQCNQGVVITDDLDTNRRRYYTESSPTLTSHSGGLKVNKIRRLTEIECERLQGFPDDWTKFGLYDGKVKQIPKTQRYKLCGNAVMTDCVKAIGERLIENYYK